MAPTRAVLLFCVHFYYDEQLMLLFLGLFRQENSLYVGEDAALNDSHACKKFVQFLIISNSQLQVSRYYFAFLVVSRGVSSQLENLGA